MSRVVQKSNSHGSLKDIQVLVNNDFHLLNTTIAEQIEDETMKSIQWVSPLKRDNYAEYRDESFLELLNVSPQKVPLNKFWPRNGPQWDALGMAVGQRLILLEAKAHIDELSSQGSSAGKESLKQITNSLSETKRFLGVQSDIDWTGTYYQYANRVAYLYFLNVLNSIPAFLVSVYFLNDASVTGPRHKGEWIEAIDKMKLGLGLVKNPLDKYCREVFIDLEEMKGEAKVRLEV